MPQSPPSDSGGEDPSADDFISPEDEFRPPLPPEDRIWRHPSEVAAASRAQAPVATRPPGRVSAGRASIATVAVSALIGATLSLGIVAALGGFDDRVVERRVAVDLSDPGHGGTHTAVTTQTAPSVVGLSIRAGDEWTTGNAVVLRSDGHLLTSGSSIEDAEEVQAHLSSGDTVAGEIVGRDPVTGVAVIRVHAEGLVPAVFGSSKHLDVGDDAMTVALLPDSGWEPMVTTGVVRAIGQRAERDGNTLHDVIVIDADIPPSVAGAPLLDPRGAVVGVLASAETISAAGGTVVIPIDDAVRSASQIIEFGHARHVWLGVGGHDLDRDRAAYLGMDGGAEVTAVLPDSPAETAGIAPGDVITAVDGAEVSSMTDLVLELRTHEPGDTVELTVTKGDTTDSVEATLAERDR